MENTAGGVKKSVRRNFSQKKRIYVKEEKLPNINPVTKPTSLIGKTYDIFRSFVSRPPQQKVTNVKNFIMIQLTNNAHKAIWEAWFEDLEKGKRNLCVCPLQIYRKWVFDNRHIRKIRMDNDNDLYNSIVLWAPCKIGRPHKDGLHYNILLYNDNGNNELVYATEKELRAWMNQFINQKKPIFKEKLYEIEEDADIISPDSEMSMENSDQAANIINSNDDLINVQFLALCDTFHDFGDTFNDTFIIKTTYDGEIANVNEGTQFKEQDVKKVLENLKLNGLSYEHSVEKIVEDHFPFLQGVMPTLDYNEVSDSSSTRVVLGVPGDIDRYPTGIFKIENDIKTTLLGKLDIIFGAPTRFVIDRSHVDKKYFGDRVINTCASVFDGSCSSDALYLKDNITMTKSEGNTFFLESYDICKHLNCRPNKNEYKQLLSDAQFPSNTKNYISSCNEGGKSASRNDDVIKFLHDLKRLGDMSQVKSALILKQNSPAWNIVFVTHDIIASIYARMLGLNVILTTIEHVTRTRIMKVYKTANTSVTEFKKKQYKNAYNEIKRIFGRIQSIPDIAATRYNIQSIEFRKVIQDYISRIFYPPFTVETCHPLYRAIFLLYGMHLLTVYKQLVFNLKECTNIRNIYLKNVKFSAYNHEYTNRTNFEQVLKLYNKVKHFNDISLSMVWNTNSFDNFIGFANVLTQGVDYLQMSAPSSDAVTLMRTLLNKISRQNPLDTDNAFYIELLEETTFLLNINNITSPEYPVKYNEIKRYINDRMTMLVDDVFLKQNDTFTRMRNIDYWKTFIAKSPIRGGASDNPSIDTTVYSHYAVYLLNKAANEPTKANVNLLLSTIYKYTSKSLLKMQFPPVSQLRRLNYEEYIKIDPRMNNPLYSTIFSMYTDPKLKSFDDGPIKRSRTSTRSYSQKRKTTSLKTLSPKAQSAPAALEQPQTHPSVSESANVSVSESVSANVRSSSKKSIRSSSAVNKSNNTSSANSASVDSLFGPGSESPTTTLLPLPTERTRNTKKKSK